MPGPDAVRVLILVAAVVLTLVAYAAWCLLAFRALRGSRPDDLMNALRYGAACVVLSLVLGMTLLGIATMAAPAANKVGASVPLLLPGMVVVHVFAWLGVGGLILAHTGAPMPALPRRVLWIAGGVVLAFSLHAVLVVLLLRFVGLH